MAYQQMTKSFYPCRIGAKLGINRLNYSRSRFPALYQKYECVDYIPYISVHTSKSISTSNIMLILIENYVVFLSIHFFIHNLDSANRS